MTAKIDVIHIFERMAAKGTAPEIGCSLFGTGFEDVFARLQTQYLKKGFQRGRSAEKLIVGDFGSGKTHFLRQFMEIASDVGCVVSYVPLAKALDFTKTLTIYREVVDALVLPGQPGHGIERLIEGCIDRIKRQAPGPALADQVLDGWIAGIALAEIDLPSFRRVLKTAFEAYLSNDVLTREAAFRWLGGDVSNRDVAKRLAVSPVPGAEQNQHGLRSLLSLFQFIKHAGFQGTVVGFDEAEQSLDVVKARRDRVHSLLQSMINALSDLQHGAALLLYAVTPPIVEGMDAFAALQQRIADPGAHMGFFDGNTSAVKIDLRVRWGRDPEGELRGIGRRLVEVFYEHSEKQPSTPREEVLQNADRRAARVAANNASSTSRRDLVKSVCAMLMQLDETGILADPSVELVYGGEEPDDEV